MDTYTGTRANPFNGSPGFAASPEGEAAFVVMGDGAVLSGFNLSNFKAVVRQKSDAPGRGNLTVRQINSTNVYRFWDTVDGQPTAGALIEDVHVIGIERNFAYLIDVSDVLIQRVYADMAGNIGKPFGAGILMDKRCVRVTVRDSEFRNFGGLDALGTTYVNGDGLDIGRDMVGIVIGPNVAFRFNSDGGLDDKGRSRTTGLLIFEGNHRDHRIWEGNDPASDATIDSIGCRGQIIWMNGQSSTGSVVERPVATIAKLIARDPHPDATSITRFENGPADLAILDYEIHKGWRGKLLHFNASGGLPSPTYPYGGRVEQNDGSWIPFSGAPPTGTGGVLL